MYRIAQIEKQPLATQPTVASVTVERSFRTDENMPAPELGLTARAIVDRVVDGDTLDVFLTIPVRVRLLRCWAPETHGAEKSQGETSKALLEQMAPKGTKVRVQVPTGDADALGGVLTFGRVLGNVWVGDDEDSLSDMMVNAGAATREKVKP